METIQRPKPGENDEDILRMQEEFQKTHLQGNSCAPISVNLTRMSNRTNPLKSNEEDPKINKSRVNNKNQLSKGERKKISASKRNRGRFTIDLETLQEESNLDIVTAVQEKNLDYLENTDQTSFMFSGLSNEYSKDDGFPDVIDLSRYFKPDESGKILENPNDGRSLFAIEFDRLNGKIYEAIDESFNQPSTTRNDMSDENEDAISKENDERIKSMTSDEILSAQREIVERFDPKLIEFLRTRSRKKASKAPATEENRKESRFKQIREMGSKNCETSGLENEQDSATDNVVIKEKLDSLEVFPAVTNQVNTNRIDDDNTTPYTRLAVEAVQLDFATKCLRTIIPRQQQNIVRLFDSFTKPLEGYEGNDELLEMARSNIPAIKGLYLDEMNSEKGVKIYQFADGLNPMTEGAWTLLPIRSILDNYQKDFQITVEDVVVIRLCMLWTLLMMTERGSLFYACNKPEDVFVRLSEIFLIGPEVFKDDVIKRCCNRVLLTYILPKAKRGTFSLVATEPIAKLDAFMPFYDDLMKRFEEYSFGDETFSLVLLIGAYMNSSLSDSMLMRCALWSPHRKIVRQITLSKQAAPYLLEHLRSTCDYWCEEMETNYYVQYSQLLAMYAAAIRNDQITRDRNPILFEIASFELGHFIKRHSSGDTQKNPFVNAERIKEFDVMVDIIRGAVNGKLQL